MTSLGKKNISELLPFYVNGSLDESEAAIVRDAVEADANLADEERELRSLRDQMQNQTVGNSPGELGLARLMRDIDRAQPAPLVEKRTVWASLAASAVTALAIFGWTQMTNEPVYVQASGESAIEGIEVLLHPNITVQELSDTLIDLELVIVDGPTALGIYRIGPEAGQELSEVANKLMGLTNVFDYVGEY